MADLSDEPEVIPAMLKLAAEGCDRVCGSRYMSGGEQIGAPRLKAFLSYTAGRSLHLLTRLPVQDATNSFRLSAATSSGQSGSRAPVALRSACS